MRDGHSCLLLRCDRQARLIDDDQSFSPSWWLPKTCRYDVSIQFSEAKPGNSEKRKKPRREKLRSGAESNSNKQKGNPCTDYSSIVSTGQVVAKSACHSSHEAADQKEDTSLLPGLDEGSALRCLAFVSRSDHGKLASLARRYFQLVRSPLLFQLRRNYGIVEQWVCIYTSGPGGWTAFDPKRNAWINLPPTPADPNFALSDRESLSAGTHLLWLGKEAFDYVCYRYDLVTNRWEKGPSMVNPRCLFASASCQEFAFVAGGFGAVGLNILNSAERYDSVLGRWNPLPPMTTPRHKCSGFYMDGKFFVIGGKDRDHRPITSGEEYDPTRQTWRTIPDMYPAPQAEPAGQFEPSPPLVAVADNQLYAIENSTNLLKLYDKGTNTWKILGPVPVRADFCNGWGLAFKALGDELFVIGGYRDSWQNADGVAVFSWRPQPDATEPEWQLVNHRVGGTGNFLYNCAVMAC